MNERANSINGQLNIISEIDKGTKICVSISKNIFMEPLLGKTADGN
jgi:nitrate/nitrite-specific signal transduction histidine kinase